MRFLLFALLSLLVSVPSFAQEKTYQYFSPKHKKYLNVKTVKIKKITLSKNCMQAGKPNCMAWRLIASTTAKPSRREVLPVLGHPAAAHCTKKGGENRIIKDADAHVDVCFFKDNSFVDSWDLYDAKK